MYDYASSIYTVLKIMHVYIREDIHPTIQHANIYRGQSQTPIYLTISNPHVTLPAHIYKWIFTAKKIRVQ